MNPMTLKAFVKPLFSHTGGENKSTILRIKCKELNVNTKNPSSK